MNKRIDLEQLKNKKIALVLSGGVVKAASWHLGVALALEDLGFILKNNQNSQQHSPLEISTYVGSSAGAMISLYFASGHRPRDIINATLGIDKSTHRPISYRDMFYLKTKKVRPLQNDLYSPLAEFPKIIKTLLAPILKFPGFFSTEGIHRYLEKHVLAFKEFEDYHSDLFIVATQLDHSRKVIFSKYNYPNPTHDDTAVYYTGTPVADAAAASMSVPPFYTPYPIKNNYTGDVDYYIDGEIRDTLSTHVAVDNGCDVIISSWTHTPYHYHDEVGTLANYGLPSICIQAIYLMIQKKIVSSRAKIATAKDIINTVNDYMKENKFSQQHRRNIVSILERKLHHKSNVSYIDIYPDHHDYKLFFANSFSLKSDIAGHAVEMGYKKTMRALSNDPL